MRKRLTVVAAVIAALWFSPGALAAGWCGGGTETAADRIDLVTGPQEHAIVAVPSDSPDSFATRAGQLADDIASMVAWWQGQDPTRVPRWDQAAFGAASCLDVSFVRLSGSAASYANNGASSAFARVSAEIANAGEGNRYKKYLVYFDGPSVQEDVCGTGGGDFATGPAYAIVWLAGCPGVPTDSVATHELLHGLGALPAGAPHACSLAQGGSGHPCDSPQDVLYPYTTGDPLSAQVLDYNHDDYYGHSGNWLDTQDSLWLHRLDLAQVSLNVAFTGGAGRVQSDEPGVDCTVSCTSAWDQGSALSLIALPSRTSRFVRWTGSCTGKGDCTLQLDQSKSATAVYGPLHVSVRLAVTGKGHIACNPKCGKAFSAGDLLTLRAIANKGWRFKGWSGACKSTGPTCRPPTDYAVSVRATFTRR
ncbi:MAG: hypothetical protein H0X39_11270 [Actinobacteria bacterium]|nr:hypothetical protein [Actinomycetota bacterium]